MLLDVSLSLLDRGFRFPTSWAWHRAETQPDDRRLVRLEVFGDGLPDGLIASPIVTFTTGTLTWRTKEGQLLGVTTLTRNDFT